MKTIFLMFLSLCCSTHCLSRMNSFHFVSGRAFPPFHPFIQFRTYFLIYTPIILLFKHDRYWNQQLVGRLGGSWKSCAKGLLKKGALARTSILSLGRISRQRMSALFEPYITKESLWRTWPEVEWNSPTPLYKYKPISFPFAWAFFFTIYMGSLTNGYGC